MLKAYAVIGGQYQFICYGFCDTLLGAKRLAKRCAEYWDNWQGWHCPAIYHSADVVPYLSENICAPYAYCPKDGASPVAVYRWNDQTWCIDASRV